MQPNGYKTSIPTHIYIIAIRTTQQSFNVPNMDFHFILYVFTCIWLLLQMENYAWLVRRETGLYSHANELINWVNKMPLDKIVKWLVWHNFITFSFQIIPTAVHCAFVISMSVVLWVKYLLLNCIQLLDLESILSDLSANLL